MYMGYPKGVKGYKLWYSNGDVSKSFINRDVIFKNDQMFMNLGGAVVEKKSEDQSCLEQVELEFQNDSEHQDNEINIDNHGQEEQEPIVHVELHGYQVARDKVRRRIKTPARYAHADVISYALRIAEETDDNKPLTFK